MANFSRRDFLKSGLAATALAGAGSLGLAAAKQSATDMVTLGDSGVKVTRLAFGTGTMNGRVQRNLGQEGFTRLVRYAYDRGIRFFETAQSYPDMHRMLGVALKGIPRDSYQLMTKVTTWGPGAPTEVIDRLRTMARTDYFDIMLLHYQHFANWPTESLHWQEAISEAQEKKIVRSHGASVHGLPALDQFPKTGWVQIAMIRMNQKGVHMDAENYATGGLGDVPAVVHVVKEVRKQGKGVISMKLVGQGEFTRRAERQAAMKFAFQHAGVDAVTVGYKNKQEVDEAIENVNLAFA